MTKLYASASATLTASLEERTLSGLLLPFGEVGRTNLGPVTVTAGTLTLPDDPSDVILNLEHEATRPLGRAVTLTETDEGIVASFTLARTRAADDALAEAAEGLRACLSVEVDDPVIDKSGRMTAGRVTGAALVVRPAYPSARLAAELREDLEDTDDEDEEDQTSETADSGELEDEELEDEEPAESGELDDPTPSASTSEEKDEDIMDDDKKKLAASAPKSGLRASATSKKKDDKATLFAALAGAHSGDRQMIAALSDIVPANILGIEQPAYVGELWDGKAYERQIIPAFNHAELTSYEVTGWRWKDRPTVASYAGGKTEVPSGTVSTEQIKITAERIAGAHDIDRKFRDFNDTEFFAAYFAAMTESYARVSDATVLAKVVAGATKVTAGTVPSGIAPGLVQIVDGILAVLGETDVVPDTAFVAPALYRDILLTRSEDVLGYLDAALGFEDGTMRGFKIKPSAQIEAGKVLVSCRDAVTVHELGGGAPIRVEALDIARGGIDEGVFGYLAVNIHDKAGLALVSPKGV